MSITTDTLTALHKLRDTIAGRCVDLENDIARTKNRSLRQIKQQSLALRRALLADIDLEIRKEAEEAERNAD